MFWTFYRYRTIRPSYRSIIETSIFITRNSHGVTRKTQASRRDALERRLRRYSEGALDAQVGGTVCHVIRIACMRTTQVTMLLSHGAMAQDDANLRICVTERLVAHTSYLEPVRNTLNLVTVFDTPRHFTSLHLARKDEARFESFDGSQQFPWKK